MATPTTQRSPKAKTVQERLLRSISRRPGEVVLRRELNGFASPSQLSRSLRQLVAEGKLVRIGLGVYAKAAPSPLSGQPAPRQGLAVLAAETFDRLGIKWQLGEDQRLYNAGLTSQVPWRTSFDTGRRRISRRLQVGLRVVDYENDYQNDG